MHFLPLVVTPRLPRLTKTTRHDIKKKFKSYISLSRALFSSGQVTGCSLLTATCLSHGCLSWTSWWSSYRCSSPTQISDYGSARRRIPNFPLQSCRLASRWPLNHQRCGCSHTQISTWYIYCTGTLYMISMVTKLKFIVLTPPPVVPRVWKPTWSVCTSWWRRTSSTAAWDPSSTGSCSSPSAFSTASYWKGRSFYSWAGTLSMASMTPTLRSGQVLERNRAEIERLLSCSRWWLLSDAAKMTRMMEMID